MERFVGAFMGVLEGLKTGKSTLVKIGKSTLVGPVVDTLVGDLVGALVGPLMGTRGPTHGSRFAFACSVRHPISYPHPLPTANLARTDHIA